jgi:hypothetical protein
MNQVEPEEIEVIKKLLTNESVENLNKFYCISFYKDDDSSWRPDSYLQKQKSELTQEFINSFINKLLTTEPGGNSVIVIVKVLEGLSDFTIEYGEDIFKYKIFKVSFVQLIKASIDHSI